VGLTGLRVEQVHSYNQKVATGQLYFSSYKAVGDQFFEYASRGQHDKVYDALIDDSTKQRISKTQYVAIYTHLSTDQTHQLHTCFTSLNKQNNPLAAKTSDGGYAVAYAVPNTKACDMILHARKQANGNWKLYIPAQPVNVEQPTPSATT
jgi:hypothetical protein